MLEVAGETAGAATGKVEQQTRRPQRRYICGPCANYLTILPLNSQTPFAAWTRSGRENDGGDSGVSGGDDHTTSVPTPAGMTGPRNEPLSMGTLKRGTCAAESTKVNGAQARTNPGVEQSTT